MPDRDVVRFNPCRIKDRPFSRFPGTSTFTPPPCQGEFRFLSAVITHGLASFRLSSSQVRQKTGTDQGRYNGEVLSHRCPKIAKGLPNTEVHAFDGRAEGQQRHILPGVVRALRRRVDTVIGGDQHQIFVCHPFQEFRNGVIKALSAL